MVGLSDAPPVAIREAPAAAGWLGDNAATDASIARYLGAGDSIATLMDIGWKVCAVLFVLVAVAWALGVLPLAVRLF
jgi:hypothetical protein